MNGLIIVGYLPSLELYEIVITFARSAAVVLLHLLG